MKERSLPFSHRSQNDCFRGVGMSGEMNGNEIWCQVRKNSVVGEGSDGDRNGVVFRHRSCTG